MPRITRDESLDLYDYLDATDARPKRRKKAAAPAFNVTDDWPDSVPITEQEIRIFETWFGDILDRLFSPR
jgi:hypothetical protein